MDRKTLIEQYKKTKRPMGVYRVRNTQSGRSLIGSSTDVRAILNRHQAQLQLRSHAVAALQSDWDTLGPDAFAFEVLDTLEPREDAARDERAERDELRALEELWVEKLSASDDLGYTPRVASRGGVA